jgi:hypothetical protein
MTAVIGIFNKEGAVLAADSAVSYQSKDGLISRNTGNKIFPLSSDSPLAVMVYGASNFVGIPLELILGGFPAAHKGVAFGHLPDCMDALLQHFQNHVADGEPEMFLVHRFVEEIFRVSLPGKGELEPRDVREGFEWRVLSMSQNWTALPRWDTSDPVDKSPPLPMFMESVGLALRHQVGVHCDGQRPIQVDDQLVAKVAGLVLLMLSRIPTLSGTGLILAGYGDRDMFPGYIELVIEGAFKGRVRYYIKSKRDVSHFQPAFLASFGQSHVIEGFLQGVDPHMYRFLLQRCRDTLVDLVQLFVSSVEEDQQPRVELALREVVEKSICDLQEEVLRYQDQSYSHLASQALALLSQEDLAEIGEVLITLTAIQKRISKQVEDVGGPIDIASLTKQDGLVWLQRKPKYSLKNTRNDGQQLPRCS